MIVPHRSRRGFILVVALCLLTLVGILCFASFGFVGSLDRASRHSLVEARLDLAAASVLTAAGDSVQSGRTTPGWLAVGASRTFEPPVPAGLTGTVSITRVGARLYWVVAEVADVRGGVRRLNVVLRAPVWNVRAGLASAGDVEVRNGFSIGSDSVACGDAPSEALVLLAPDAALSVDGSSPPPATAVREALADSSYFMRLLGVPWAELVERAGHRLPHGASVAPAPRGPDCRSSDPDNWGDPVAPEGTPCAGYQPVIHAAGDLELHGGRGTGLLLVEGHLRVTGPLYFAGVVVALGGLTIQADGARVDGSVLAFRRGAWRPGPAVTLDGLSELRHSTCATDRTAASFGDVRPVQGRAWAELF